MSDVKISITLDAAQLKRELGLTEAELKKVDGKQISVKTDAATGNVNKLTDSFASMAMASVAAAVSISKVFQTIGQAVTEARDAVAAQRLLQSQLAATGDAAGISADNLKRIAGELQQISNIGDDAIIQNLTVPLTTFKQISGDVFERTQKAILDMNSVLGDPNNPGSLRSMAVQVGKALNDPILGLTALRRVGVSFSDSQMDVIKNLIETNRLAEAQAMILTELESEFGGAAASTINSSIQMKNAWGDYLEALGVQTLPILDGVNLAFANFFTVMAGNAAAFADSQQHMMMVNFRSMNEFATSFALNAEAVVKLVWGTVSAVTGAIHGVVNLSRNALIGWAQTAWDLIGKLPAAAMEAIGLGDITALSGFADEVKNNFTPAISDAQLSLKIMGEQFDMAISGFRDYEKNFSAITDNSLKSYVKTLELRKSLGNIDVDTGGNGSGSVAASAAQAEVSETAKAYAVLLENLRKYHSDAALEKLSSHQKAMALINAQFEEEQAVILASMAAKEISEEEGQIRLLEIRGKYDAQTAIERKKADDEILALAKERMDKAVQDEVTYYETMKFADSGYYEWKKAQIRAEVEALAIGDAAKLELIKKHFAELDALKAENDQAAAASPGHWFFTGLLGFDPDKDQDKIEKAKNAFRGLQDSVSTSISGLMNMSKQRQQQELSAIDEVAAKQNLSDADIAKRKAAINKKYEAEQKRVGNIQKAASIAQTIIHSREAAMAAYKALSGIPIIGPAMGAGAAAAAIAAGAIQIAVIKAQKFATGGLFRGQGGPRDDKNLAYISDGEYIVNADATKRFQPILDAINYGRSVTRAYADGGLVAGTGGMESLMRQLITKVEILNLNLVKKELSVINIVKPGITGAAVRTLDGARNRMEERGYDPAFS
jgi:hypothetical protein